MPILDITLLGINTEKLRVFIGCYYKQWLNRCAI
jgi:hypothetical protein